MAHIEGKVPQIRIDREIDEENLGKLIFFSLSFLAAFKWISIRC